MELDKGIEIINSISNYSYPFVYYWLPVILALIIAVILLFTGLILMFKSTSSISIFLSGMAFIVAILGLCTSFYLSSKHAKLEYTIYTVKFSQYENVDKKAFYKKYNVLSYDKDTDTYKVKVDN